jgi:hypothetical protein
MQHLPEAVWTHTLPVSSMDEYWTHQHRLYQGLAGGRTRPPEPENALIGTDALHRRPDNESRNRHPMDSRARTRCN